MGGGPGLCAELCWAGPARGTLWRGLAASCPHYTALYIARFSPRDYCKRTRERPHTYPCTPAPRPFVTRVNMIHYAYICGVARTPRLFDTLRRRALPRSCRPRAQRLRAWSIQDSLPLVRGRAELNSITCLRGTWRCPPGCPLRGDCRRRCPAPAAKKGRGDRWRWRNGC